MLHLTLVKRHISKVWVLNPSLFFFKLFMSHHVVLELFEDLIIMVNWVWNAWHFFAVVCKQTCTGTTTVWLHRIHYSAVLFFQELLTQHLIVALVANIFQFTFFCFKIFVIHGYRYSRGVVTVLVSVAESIKVTISIRRRRLLIGCIIQKRVWFFLVCHVKLCSFLFSRHHLNRNYVCMRLHKLFF